MRETERDEERGGSLCMSFLLVIFFFQLKLKNYIFSEKTKILLIKFIYRLIFFTVSPDSSDMLTVYII